MSDALVVQIKESGSSLVDLESYQPASSYHSLVPVLPEFCQSLASSVVLVVLPRRLSESRSTRGGERDQAR